MTAGGDRRAGSVAEVLEADPRGPRMSRRTVAVVAVLALVVLGAAYAVNRQVRQGEERALARCSTQAGEAFARAYQPVAAAWREAQPALDGGASLMVRYSLYERVRRSAEGRAPLVVPARQACAAVSVTALHPDLRDRRDRCVRLLDEQIAFLTEAARTGVTLNSPRPRGSC